MKIKELARTRTRTRSRTRGMRLLSASRLRSILNKVSKRTLIECLLTLWRAAPKRAKIAVSVKLEKAPKKSTTRRKTKRKTRRRAASTRKRARKSSRRKASGRRKGRTAKQRAATRKLVAFNKRRRR